MEPDPAAIWRGGGVPRKGGAVVSPKSKKKCVNLETLGPRSSLPPSRFSPHLLLLSPGGDSPSAAIVGLCEPRSDDAWGSAPRKGAPTSGASARPAEDGAGDRRKGCPRHRSFHTSRPACLLAGEVDSRVTDSREDLRLLPTLSMAENPPTVLPSRGQATSRVSQYHPGRSREQTPSGPQSPSGCISAKSKEGR